MRNLVKKSGVGIIDSFVTENLSKEHGHEELAREAVGMAENLLRDMSNFAARKSKNIADYLAVATYLLRTADAGITTLFEKRANYCSYKSKRCVKSKLVISHSFIQDIRVVHITVKRRDFVNKGHILLNVQVKVLMRPKWSQCGATSTVRQRIQKKQVNNSSKKAANKSC